MEIFKTGAGSWIYPEPSVLRIAGVPLFSGFMYAAVGSYHRARVAHLGLPLRALSADLAAGGAGGRVYANFFTHHYLPDMRLGLFVASALIYGPCMLYYRPDRRSGRCRCWSALCWWRCSSGSPRTSALSPAPGSIPARQRGWHPVSLDKLGSWYLLMIISFVLVAAVHREPPADSNAPIDPAKRPAH